MPLRRAILPAAVLLTLVRAAAAQDFDPRGRHRPAPHVPPPHAPVAAPARPASSPAVLLERYLKVVLAQPGAAFPLQRLAQLYRDRDGKLDALVLDLTARSSQPGADQFAATVALAGVLKLDGRAEAALQAFAAAVALRPGDPIALLALAHLQQDRGDNGAARASLERALALQTTPADRAQTLRTLLALALDAKTWDDARRFHAELVKQDPSSLFVRGELGRELYARGEYELAVVELRGVVAAAAGDNRTLAPALKDLGQAQAKAHESADALATLDRALAAAGPGAAVRTEIWRTITEVYRADQTLPNLIKKLEDQRAGDFVRIALLATLYEEVGDAHRAIAAYRRALALDPRQIDLRVKMIRLLQADGDLDEAIVAYEGIVRTAPNNPQFVFEMCEALLQRGDRARALRLLNDLERRAANDEDAMTRLGEFYSRIGESEGAIRVLARLANIGGGDPSHLADLGDHYFQEGKTAQAVATWKRMLVTVAPRARALAALGDVYVEHDMLPEALVALREAAELDPSNAAYKKDLAGALERSKSYAEASLLWESLAEKARQTSDKVLAREARARLVVLWTLDHSLDRKAREFAASFDATPPDVDAGRTLAEVLLHQRRLFEAETTLRKVVALAPGDGEVYLALERVLVQEGKLDEAIAVLTKLLQVEPRRARETYQRMAQYALQIYKDGDAITYAARAVELNPDDAEGHRRLGDMYRSRQDAGRAVVEYRAAITKNERLYLVYFDLADLLLARGESDEADRLLRRVLRGAPDEELVARAARLSMQINLGKGTLASLEQDLVPLAIGNPQKPIYRRLLVEMYGDLTFGLVQRVKHGALQEGREARSALARVGQRAVKPLLDALADGDPGQQRVAIDVLSYVGNKNAGPALFGFATGNADAQLRVRAMVACGALRDPALLPRYEAYLRPRGKDGVELTPSDAVAVSAVWGVARMGDGRAIPILRSLARTGTPDVRALAALGLGALHDRAAVGQLTAILRELDAGDVVRAAAAYALGDLGADSASAPLVALAEEGDALPRQLALISLARLSSGHGRAGSTAEVAAMARAVFEGGEGESLRTRLVGESLRRAGAAALTILAGGPSAIARAARATADIFPVPDGGVLVEPLLTKLVPEGFSAEERAAALVTYSDAIGRAAASALETSSGRARAVLQALAGGGGSLEPFLGPEASPSTVVARQKAERLIASLEPVVLALVRHPDPLMRAQAVGLLGHSPSEAAQAAVVDASVDPDQRVARAALGALGARESSLLERSVVAAGRVLGQSPTWALRVLAAEALARLARHDTSRDAASRPAISADLERAVDRDPFALVREAALRALVQVDAVAAAAAARRAVAVDPEPRVQQLAQSLLAPRDGAGSTKP